MALTGQSGLREYFHPLTGTGHGTDQLQLVGGAADRRTGPSALALDLRLNLLRAFQGWPACRGLSRPFG